MTGKRFTLKGLIEGVPNICDNDKIIEQEEAVDLLNGLNNENEQLKQQLTEIKEILNNLNSMDCYWDSAILTGVMENIANVIGVDLGE